MRYFWITLLGIVSGFISFSYEDGIHFPGIIFGISILIAIHFIFKKKLKIWQQITILTTSGVGYYIAFITTYNLDGNHYNFLIGGLIGSGILSLCLFISKPKFYQLLILILIGGLIAYFSTGNDIVFYLQDVISYLNLDYKHFLKPYDLLSLFVLWQTIILLIITTFINRNLPKEVN